MTNWLSHAAGALRPSGVPAERRSLTRRALEQRTLPPGFRDRFLAIGWTAFVCVTFVLFIAAPLTLTAVYETFVASPTYVTEARFAVRQATDRPLVDTYLGAAAFESLPSPTAERDRSAKQTMGGGGAAAARVSAIVSSVLQALGGSSDNAEPFIVSDYVSSLEMVSNLDKDRWLRAHFAAGDPDWLQALPEGASQEDLVRYWRSAVSATLDTTSGLISLSVSAFTPDDSRAIAERAIAETEALLSRMVERARHDRMDDAKQLLAHAQERYVTAQEALQQLRADKFFIDPKLAAQSSFTQLMELISARIALDVQLRMIEPGLSPSAPQLKVLKTRIAALDEEIKRAKSALTDAGEGATAASNYLAAFETRETERLLAIALYESALDTLERVRLAAERQASYLAVFVPPTTPEGAAGPNLVDALGTVALIGFLLWGTVIVVAAASRDQMG